MSRMWLHGFNTAFGPIFLLVVFIVGSLPAKTAIAAPPKKGGTIYSCGKAKGQVSVSFKPEVQVKDLITWAMGFTCKNFVYGPGIVNRKGKVTIIAPKKMSANQAWRLFLVSLETMNLTVVPKGNVLKIVESPQSKKESLPLYINGTPSSASQMVRMVMRPQHVTAEDASAALNTLLSKDGNLTTLGKVGMIVLTDYGDNIARMRTLMKELDRPTLGERLYMIRVRHADAQEIATTLKELLGEKNKTAPKTNTRRRRNNRKTPAAPTAAPSDVETAVPSKILADERTNGLIILGSEAAYERVKALVGRLDVAVDVEGEGRIHVYYLENADATELATTLQSVITGVRQPNQSSTANRRRASTPTGVGGAAFEGNVNITGDAATNALVIVASVKDFLSLRGVLRKLDVPRRQVFIEAVIMEVNAGNSIELGGSYHAAKELDSLKAGTVGVGGFQPGGDAAIQSLNPASLAAGSGFLGGVLGPLLPGTDQFPGLSIPSFGILFNAVAGSSDVNVLSSPHILTTDNEEAEISVGENIPFQSSLGSLGNLNNANTAGLGIPIQNIQRQDILLTLKITPHINDSDNVRLEIDQEISDVASADFQGQGLGPSWSKRTIKTTVNVRDQHSVVIGGLMSSRVNVRESKVPLLGDIPILGYLFKHKTKRKTKTNLLVVLTPYVVKDQLDLEEIVQRKLRERREFVRSMTTLKDVDFEPHADYRKKHGLVEHVNKVISEVDREIQLRKEIQDNLVDFPDGPIEVTPKQPDPMEVVEEETPEG